MGKRKPVKMSSPAKGNKFRPNFARQMLFAGITLASILGGYVLFIQLAPNFATPEKPGSSPQPWYQKQSPPPSLITGPDAPLFPEPDEITEPSAIITAKPEKRAYEEALPKEIFEPPAVKKPQPEPQPQLEPQPESVEITSLPPWRRYAVELASPGRGPLIAIVIDDMGVDRKRSARAINFKAPLTLSFLTYADDLDRQTGQARANGHELMLHVAMEPSSTSVDPGPNVLLTGHDEKELQRRLDWGFGRFSGYVGINNHMGSKFTADRRGMEVVMRAVKSRGLLFLDSRTSAATVAGKLARRLGVPSVERNIFIDNVNRVEAVNARLVEVEKLATRTGYAVAIGHPRQATIEALEVWLGDIEARGFRLAPLSAIVEIYGTP